MISWSHDHFSVNTKTFHFGKMVFAGTEKAYKNKTCKFSARCRIQPLNYGNH